MAAPDRFEIAEVDADAWDGFLAEAVGATPFSASPWVDAAAAAMAGEARRWGAWQEGRLVAGVAGCEAGSGWRRRFCTPDLLPHTGFLFRPSASDRPAHVESERCGATTALAAYLASRYPRVQLTHAPAVTDTRPFQWAGWEVTPRFTYGIDLPQDRQAVWDGCERRTRTAVRKADRAGFVVEPSQDVAELVRLYAAIYGDAAPPVAAALVEGLAAGAVADGRARAWRCRQPSGATAAVVAFVDDGQTLYAWVAGADPGQRDSGAASLLYWKVLEQTACRRFDFVGANLPSVAFFKRGFGGNLVPYFATVSRRSRPLRLASALRRAL